MFVSTAPFISPPSVRVLVANSTTISVQLGMVPCIHQNGPITGYSVRYGVIGSGNTQTVPVSGASQTQLPSTTYSIQVAAVNVVGIGVYSAGNNSLTPETSEQ